MSDMFKVLEAIDNSALTTFGFDSISEQSVEKLFDYISSRNPNNTIRFCTDGYRHSDTNSFVVTTYDEIYTKISEQKNKLFIIDNISMLPTPMLTGSTPMSAVSMAIKELMTHLKEHCYDNNCTAIVGNHTYDYLIGSGQARKRLKGGHSISHASDNVIFVSDNNLSFEKCRYSDIKEIKDFNLLELLREDKINELLNE